MQSRTAVELNEAAARLIVIASIDPEFDARVWQLADAPLHLQGRLLQAALKSLDRHAGC